MNNCSCLIRCKRALTVLLIVAILIIPLNSYATGGEVCGTSANADIVIMIDKTGSTSSSDLQIMKNAAKDLLTFFSSAIERPRVAIGTFNCTDSSCTNGARIAVGGGLTSNYGSPNPASGLYAVINGISSPSGNTNIKAAIDVAQAELGASGGSDSNYIILISDGIANRPTDFPGEGGASCGTCNCLAGRLAGDNAATNAETSAAGTQIFTVHYYGENGSSACQSGSPSGEQIGIDYLRGTNNFGGNPQAMGIASNPNMYYEGNADLSGVFLEIASEIGCDDNNPCTQDACNQNTNLCEYQPDSSAQCDCSGVPGGNSSYDRYGTCCAAQDLDDCNVCRGQNADLDECGVCFGDNSTCSGCPGATDDCGVCEGNNVDKDDCGVCFGNNSAKDLCGVCFGDNTSCENVCQETVVTSTLVSLDGLGLEYRKFVSAVVKKYRKQTGKLNAFAAELEEAEELYLKNWELTWTVPEIIKSNCLISELCVSVDNTGTLVQYAVNHQRFGEIAAKIIGKLKKLPGTTALVKKYSKRNGKLQNKEDPLIAQIPPIAEECSTPGN